MNTEVGSPATAGKLRSEVGGQIITRLLLLVGCLCLGAVGLIPTTAPAASEKKTEAVADKLHTPPEGSAEREVILDGLRKHWQTSDGKRYRGRISFHVRYLKAHNGWAWVYADPRSSIATEGFPENSGFLLRLKAGQWEVVKLPPMDDNGDGAFNPSPADIARIRKLYPAVAADVIPVEKRR